MKIKLVAYGIARDILPSSEMEFTLEGESVEELKTTLVEQYPDFDKLRHLRFAVGEEYREDNYQLSENDEVVIIPPVSGG